MTKSERALVWILRILGGMALLATIAALMPYSWMQITHRFLGMGEMPDAPVVEYLARSTSAFYAFHGALAVLISFNVRRYKRIIVLFGWFAVVFGIGIFIVDVLAGMPAFWIASEGPFVVPVGIAILCLTRGIQE